MYTLISVNFGLILSIAGGAILIASFMTNLVGKPMITQVLRAISGTILFTIGFPAIGDSGSSPKPMVAFICLLAANLLVVSALFQAYKSDSTASVATTAKEGS